MPKVISNDLATHIAGQVTSLCTLWRMVRKDGRAFHFTDHDLNVEFEGNTYSAATGFVRSAIKSGSDMSPDNLDVEGIFDSQDMTVEDLRAGMFDGAEIRVYVVNWADPGQGAVKMRRGFIGEVMSTPNGQFRGELRGLMQRLSQNIVNAYTADCRHDLGDEATCSVPIMPDEVGRGDTVSTTSSTGRLKRVRVATDPAVGSYGSLSIVNAGFEAGSLTGWTQTSGTWSVVTTAGPLTPFEGTYFLSADTAGTLTQVVDLRASMGGELDDDDLTEGEVFRIALDVRFGRGSGAGADTARMVVDVLNAADGVISTLGDTTAVTEDAWVSRVVAGTLPALAAKLRIRLISTASGALDAYYDALRATWSDLSVIQTSERFEDTYYEVTVAGTLAAVRPSYDTTPGAVTTDGTAQLTARDAYTRSATVTSLVPGEDDRVAFRATALTGFPDDWFNYGVVSFETGNNAGKAMEVKDYDSGDLTVKLFLPVGYEIEVGDKLAIYPGCDNRRETCKVKFNNVLNFGGFPDIPGTDFVQTTPNAH